VSERDGSWWPFAIPALVAVALVTTVFVVESAGTKHHPLTCPANYRTTTGRPWVPSVAAPVGKNGRMAPVRLPTDVVVCRFGRAAEGKPVQALAGSRKLAGPFQRLVDTVAYLPRAVSPQPRCSVASAANADFLLGLTYTDGTEWIAASGNLCLAAPTTNGSYDSDDNLASAVGTAYRTGSWPTVGTRGPCPSLGMGRSGDETKLVPDSVLSADLCKAKNTVQLAHAHLGGSAAGRAAAELNKLHTTSASGTGCFGWYDANASDVSYRLVFHYGIGADTVVTVQASRDCTPVANGSRQSNQRSQAVSLAEELLAGQ
jgi:hypothetical protein